MINDVLEFSKIEAGKIELNPENFDLHNLLLGLEEMFRLRALEKGLSLDFTIGSKVPQYIRADQNKIRQILINLLGNAVKFTETGGITLSVTNKEPCNQEHTSGCLLSFEVTDTGVGISQQEQVRVFEAFYQSGNQNSATDGTGLGLSISHKFADLMNGELLVSSKEGQGTCFTFNTPVLPADRADAASKEARRVIGLAPGQPCFRLLVVEDNYINRNLLVQLLRNTGFEVQETVNGLEAVEVWRKWQPHLIWMDMRMPVMNGYEAIRKIKSEMQNAECEGDTKIIAITASVFKEDHLKVIEHGGDDFVRKPFKEAEILEIMEKYLKIQYIYQEEENGLERDICTEKMSDRSLITAFKGLSRAIIAKLQESIELSDADIIDQIIEEIRCKNDQLADALGELAKSYAYDKILYLIHEALEQFDSR